MKCKEAYGMFKGGCRKAKGRLKGPADKTERECCWVLQYEEL